MKWIILEPPQHPHNPKLCAKRIISAQEVDMKKQKIFRKHFFALFFIFFEMSKLEISKILVMFLLFIIGNPLVNQWIFGILHFFPKNRELGRHSPSRYDSNRDQKWCFWQYWRGLWEARSFQMPRGHSYCRTRKLKFAVLDENCQNTMIFYTVHNFV